MQNIIDAQKSLVKIDRAIYEANSSRKTLKTLL
jgi:hypothetical protein